MTNLIKEYLQIYLQGVVSGERKLSPDSIALLSDELIASAERQFSNEKATQKWRPRMSGLGKPLCQQQLERDGVKVNKKMKYSPLKIILEEQLFKL